MNAFQDSLPPTPTATPGPIAEEEEYYSSWSLFLVCVLLIISLWTSYYLQIKRIRAIHETLVSIVAGMFVGFVVRLAPGHLIREMLVSYIAACCPSLHVYKGNLPYKFFPGVPSILFGLS